MCLELGVGEQEQLVKDNGKIDGAERDNDSFHDLKIAQDAEKDQGEGDNSKFPDPEIRSIKGHDGLNHRIDLMAF